MESWMLTTALAGQEAGEGGGDGIAQIGGGVHGQVGEQLAQIGKAVGALDDGGQALLEGHGDEDHAVAVEMPWPTMST